MLGPWLSGKGSTQLADTVAQEKVQPCLSAPIPMLKPDLPQVSTLCGPQPCSCSAALAGPTPSVVQRRRNLSLASGRTQARVSVRVRVKVGDLGGHHEDIGRILGQRPQWMLENRTKKCTKYLVQGRSEGGNLLTKLHSDLARGESVWRTQRWSSFTDKGPNRNGLEGHVGRGQEDNPHNCSSKIQLWSPRESVPQA